MALSEAQIAKRDLEVGTATRGPGGSLPTTTPWGERVIASEGATGEPHVDGVPLSEWLDSDIPLKGDGVPALQEPTSTEEEQVSLYDEGSKAFLYESPKQATPTKAKSYAANNAYTDVVLGNGEGFDARMQAHLLGTVEDATIAEVSRLIDEQDLLSSEMLSPQHLATLSPEDKLTTISNEIARINLRKTPQSDRIHALFSAYKAGSGQAPFSAYTEAVRTVNPVDIRASMDHMIAVGNEKARKEVNGLVATQGWDTNADMIANIATQDFIPFYSIISRQVLAVNMAKAAGVDNLGFGWLFLGEARQKMRDHLINLPPEQMQAAAKAQREMIERWQHDPIMAPLASKYNVLEQFEVTWSEDVLSGRSSKDTMDRFLGNFESLVEAAFSVMTLAKAGTTVRGAFTATDAIDARKAAATVGEPGVVSRIDDEFLKSELADTFQMDPDAANTTQLPRPVMLVDDIEELPQGSKDVLVMSELVRGEILSSSNGLTGAALTPLDKTNAVNKAYHDLDISDGLHTQGRMNTLAMLEDGTGYHMNVVVGETAEGGFKSFWDAMEELADIDPDLQNVTIKRVGANGTLEEVFTSPREFARAVKTGEVDASTAGRILGEGHADDTFYLSYDVEKFWHSADKVAFGPEAFQSGATNALRPMLSPNAKFGPEIYETFLKAYMGEQQLVRNFDILFQPYYKLGPDDKRFVESAFEWMEDFGKDRRRAPRSSEIYAQYDNITEAQMNGLIAMRTGMDTMHELFNRKLYREWQALGFKTARPINPDLPSWHGKVMEPENISGGVLDPETGNLVRLSRQDIADLHTSGGRVIELDMAVDVPNGVRQKANQVLVKEGTYEVGELTTSPMLYHPGYSMRFYDDPYYIVKKVDGVTLNGSARSAGQAVHSEAIATAGTNRQANARVRRLTQIAVDEGEKGVTYEVVRANNINNTESTLFQKEALHREGRLFWDERNANRLPDANGSRAKLEDPVRSLERGIGQMARLATHEDPLRSIKKAWKNDYGNLVDPRLLESFDLKELSGRLADLRRTTNGKAAKVRVREAEELINYLRLIEGTDTAVVPALREATINLAQWIGQFTRSTRGLEKFAQTVDPFKTMRSVAFHAFMVFRPLRQAALQSAQIGYLAPLRPGYVATPQFFRDAYGLRHGIAKLRAAGFDDGFSTAKAAKAMGLTKREYNVLIREFDRSGLIDLVDVHSFAGGAAKFRKTALPKNQSTLGTIGYKARAGGNALSGWMQKIGFNFGEGNNLTFTYNLALKRRMEKQGYKSVTDMTRKDWDQLKVEASNLALGMVKPNNFAYQQGAIGVMTQFLSFSHKAALGLILQNPAIKGKDALKIFFGGFAIYGANWAGMREQSEQYLTEIGVSNQNLPGTEISLVDFISSGLIDTSFNLILELLSKDHKDVDFGFMTPSPDPLRFWEMQLETLVEAPWKVVGGPFGNLASKMLTAVDMTRAVWGTPDIDPSDKFMMTGQLLLSGAFPVANDANQAYFAYKMNQWYTQSKEPLPLRPTLDGILARGLLGARTKEEMAHYFRDQQVWESEQNVEDAVQSTRKYLKQLTSMVNGGTLDVVGYQQRVAYLTNLYEDWPSGIRSQMFKQALESKQNDQTDTNIYQDIIDIVKNRNVDPSQIIATIDQMVDIPPAQREQLKQLAIEAHQGRINVDAEAQRALEEQ